MQPLILILRRLATRFLCSPWILGLFVLSSADAGGGPENAILAVNQNSPASLAVANLYVELRQIPACNVVYLDLPFAADQEQITLSQFRDLILKPIVEHIHRCKLDAQIDYIIYSADFPTAISINDAVAQLTKDMPRLSREQVQVLRPMASINALTYFAGATLNGSYAYLGLDANWYMRLPIDEAIGIPFEGDADRSFRSALVKIQAGQYEQSLQILDPLAQANPMQFATRLGIVRCEAGLGHAQETAEAIVDLARTGWGHRATVSAMPEIQRVASDASVQKALALIPEQVPAYVGTHGFRAAYLWGRNGGLNSDPEQGRRYILSTVLAVTRNNGTSLADALRYLRISAAADGTHPSGNFLFTLTSDIRTKTRQPGFDAAIAGLQQLGLSGIVVNERVPRNKKNVSGAILGDKSADWLPSLSELAPGAIVDNFTSFGGRMKGDHHTPATEFLRAGAAGSSGTVIEPFALQAKFAHPMIMVHYARGCTMAEAYYQSVHGPFQLLIVGDALCAPWASPLAFQVIGLEAGSRVQGIVKIRVDSSDIAAIDHLEIFLDGVRFETMPRSTSFSLDANSLSDGYHELRVVAVAAGPIETRSRQIIPFLVDRGGSSVQLSVRQSEIAGDESLDVTATAKVPGEIRIVQNTRVVGTVAESGGSTRIAGSHLGAGRSRLIAAVSDQDRIVHSEPVTVTVE